VLFAPLRPPPWILVLGAGLDAEPVVRLASELGWRVTVQDHRPAYIEKGNFSSAQEVLCEPADTLLPKLGWERYRAVIVMSHHLDTDRKYLAQLAATGIPYVGLLGPRNRRRRLLDELGPEVARSLEPRLHGPAGLDIGADGPASIALSILAEMHAAIGNPAQG
jgi:xanthine dehydrogenase accessory factor